MGLTVAVFSVPKYIADEGLRALEELLKSEGVPVPPWPTDIEKWDGDAFGYSGLHSLRRVAAYLALAGALPPPLKKGEDANADPHIDDYYQEYEDSMAEDKPMPFEHLMIHSDAEGLYLPLDFPRVLFADGPIIPGEMVGSLPRLMFELNTIAQALSLPAALRFGDDAMVAAAENPGGEGWRRYGVEAYHLLLLREAGARAMKQQTAVVFI